MAFIKLYYIKKIDMSCEEDFIGSPFNMVIYFQDQILGMKWLNGLIGDGLSLLGLDIASRLGGSIQFFYTM